jgi:hypothetical protein
MRMPAVHPSPVTFMDDVVAFRSACGRVEGTARRRHGRNETAQDVRDARRAGGDEPTRLTAVPGTVATFDVIGTVGFVHEDGLAIVDALGFDFWIAASEAPGPLRLGDRIAFRTESFTLFVRAWRRRTAQRAAGEAATAAAAIGSCGSTASACALPLRLLM